jgi:hypothetical protein
LKPVQLVISEFIETVFDNKVSQSINGLVVEIGNNISDGVVLITNTIKNADGNNTAPVVAVSSVASLVSFQLINFANIKGFYDIIAFLVGAVHNLFVWMRIRRKRRYWGTVYDSLTKQPIDPAVVKLINVLNGQVVEEAITDLYGRYGFLERVGKFKITSDKTNYSFPSTKVFSTTDGIYDNIYLGGNFEIVNASNIISPNIPMDPKAFDWNQVAKREFVKFHPVLDLIIMYSLQMLLIVTTIVSLLFLIYHPSVITTISFILSIISFIIGLVLPPTRLWGRVVGLPKTVPAIVALYLKNIPQLISCSHISSDGRYFLKTLPGEYILKILDPITRKEFYQKQITVKQRGVVNEIIRV